MGCRGLESRELWVGVFSGSSGVGPDMATPSPGRYPLKDGPQLQAWLRHMGCEHWVPSCHQHLCSEHFTPSCSQWRCGIRYLLLDAVPSIFSGAPTIKVSTGRSRCWRLTMSPNPAPPTPHVPHLGNYLWNLIPSPHLLREVPPRD